MLFSVAIILGKKTHRCELCGKEYTSEGNLSLHKQKHTGNKKSTFIDLKHILQVVFIMISPLLLQLYSYSSLSDLCFLYCF